MRTARKYRSSVNPGPRPPGPTGPAVEGLRGLIRLVLSEGFDDIRRIHIRLRVKVSRPSDPTVPDVLTDVRGLRNVITVSQVGAMSPAPEDRNWIELDVSFVDDDDYDLPGLVRDLREIPGVDMVRVQEGDPEDNVVTP